MLVAHPNFVTTTNQLADYTHKNKVHNHSQTHLTPQSYLQMKQTRSQRIFAQTDPLDRKIVIQKYFGKKMLYVSSRSDVVQIISFRKLFSKVTFYDEYDFINDIRTLVRVFDPFDFKCLGNQIFLDKPIQLNEKEYQKLISTLTSTIGFTYSMPNTLKYLRPSVKNIKHFNLTLPARNQSHKFKGDMFGMDSLEIVEKSFPTLTHLETFTLQYLGSDYVSSDSIESQMGVFLNFLQKLVMLKSLRTVNLILAQDRLLAKITINYQFLKGLLLCLDASHIEKWHITARLEAEELLDVKAVAPVLEKIDFLGLQFRNLGSLRYDSYIPADLREMPDLTMKRKKVLDLLDLTEYGSGKLRLSEILSYCKSLEGLYIKSISNQLNWDMTASQMASLAHVQDLILVSYEMEADPDGLFEDFLSKFKDQNSVLRSLKILFCYQETDDYTTLIMPHYLNRFNGMESLEDLTLYSDGCHNLDPMVNFGDLSGHSFVDHVNDMSPFEGPSPRWSYTSEESSGTFGSLVNLKRLTLHLCKSDKTALWDLAFPFYRLDHLTEFRLIIHGFMKIPPWEDSFAEHIALLSNLQVLEIIDRSYQKNVMPLCVFYSLLKKLCHFQNLRKLNLQVNLKNDVPKDTLFIVGEEHYNKCELKVIEDIKGKVMRIISANRFLEELDIGEFEGFSIPCISYKKLVEKEWEN